MVYILATVRYDDGEEMVNGGEGERVWAQSSSIKISWLINQSSISRSINQ